MNKLQVAIVGSGSVGEALREGLVRAGHAVEFVPRDPEQARPIVQACDVVVFAIPWDARRPAVDSLGAALDGKILIDVTNPVKPGLVWSREGERSGAEEIQEWAPRARVVKAFNTVFSAFMPTGRIGEAQLSAFVAGDDAAARGVVLEMAKKVGFDAVDSGPLETARWLESLLYLEMVLGFKVGHGADIGFRFVRKPA